MRIALTSIPVADQAAARRIYTRQLGFVVKHDVPMGAHAWLTLVSPADPDGCELLLEPTAFPPSQVYQRALHDAGIPAAAFFTDDIAAEHARLVAAGVTFRSAPAAGPSGPTTALFEDGCGNFIQLVQP